MIFIHRDYTRLRNNIHDEYATEIPGAIESPHFYLNVDHCTHITG